MQSSAASLPRYSRILWRALWMPATVSFAVVGNVVLAISVAVFHHFESGTNAAVRSWFDSLWWGLSTVTTVGYGDVVPATTEGRITGMVLMVAGVSLFVGYTAILASGFYTGIEREIEESERLTMKEYQAVMAGLERIASRLEALERRLGAP